MNDIEKKYLQSVKASLVVCPKPLQKRTLEHLKDSLAAFEDENPMATEKEMIEYFGTPDEFATSFVSSMDEEDIIREIKKGKRNKRIVVITCVIALALLIGTYVYMIRDNKRSQIDIVEVTSSQSTGLEG